MCTIAFRLAVALMVHRQHNKPFVVQQLRDVLVAPTMFPKSAIKTGECTRQGINPGKATRTRGSQTRSRWALRRTGGSNGGDRSTIPSYSIESNGQTENGAPAIIARLETTQLECRHTQTAGLRNSEPNTVTNLQLANCVGRPIRTSPYDRPSTGTRPPETNQHSK